MRTETGNQRRIPVALPLIAAFLVAARIIWNQIPERDEAAERSLVKWTPLSRATELAQTQGKPILYDFTAAWCAPCRQLETEVFEDRTLAPRINATFIAVRVVDRKQEDGMNADDVGSLQKRYGVEAFPTLVIASGRGAQLARMEGFRGREAFVSLLANAARKPVQ